MDGESDEVDPFWSRDRAGVLSVRAQSVRFPYITELGQDVRVADEPGLLKVGVCVATVGVCPAYHFTGNHWWKMLAP